MNHSGFWGRFWKSCRRNPAALVALLTVALLCLAAVLGPQVAPYDPYKADYLALAQPPSASHWFGTDQLGRDLFSRVLHGARLSISIGVLSVCLGLVIGASIGMVAGFLGGRTDSILMRGIDVLLAFPGILLAILIVSIFGSGFVNVTAALAVFSVPTFARISRSTVLSVRTLDYVQAAEALGAPASQILARHVLPNAFAPLVVYGTLRCAAAILGGASLSFLGLGVAPPAPEWGLMISQAREEMRSAPHIMLFPGIAIFLTVLSVNLLGDVIRDVLDPKLRGS